MAASAVPIKPSYTAWSELPDEVREAARVGIEPDDFADAVAVVAYGRFRVWFATGLSLVAFIAIYIYVLQFFDTFSSSDQMPMSSVVAIAVSAVLNVAAAVMSRRTQRLIRTGMVRVMEEPVDGAPADLSISSRPSFIGALAGVGFSLALLTGAILVGAQGATVFKHMIGWLLFAAAVIVAQWYSGPSRSADVNANGVWLGRPELHIPWASIATISIEPTGVSIVVKGPVSPIDRAGWRWNARRHASPGMWVMVSIATRYPEMVKWVARAYTDVAETDEKVLARTPKIRRTTRRYLSR